LYIKIKHKETGWIIIKQPEAFDDFGELLHDDVRGRFVSKRQAASMISTDFNN